MVAQTKTRVPTYRSLVALWLRGAGLVVLFEAAAFGFRLAGQGVLGLGGQAFVLSAAAPLLFGAFLALLLLVGSHPLAVSLVPVDRACAPGAMTRTRRLIMLALFSWFLLTAVKDALPLVQAGVAGATGNEDGMTFLMRTRLWDVLAVAFRAVIVLAGVLGTIELSDSPPEPAPAAVAARLIERPVERPGSAPLEPE